MLRLRYRGCRLDVAVPGGKILACSIADSDVGASASVVVERGKPKGCVAKANLIILQSRNSGSGVLIPGIIELYVVRTIETKRCGKEERTEPSGWGSGDRLLMQASS